MAKDSRFPVVLTEAALAELGRLLRRKGEDGSVVRIGVKGGGCSGLEYVIRVESGGREGDLSVDEGGLTVVCDQKSARILEGSTLEYTGNLLTGGLRFDNPNAERSCGCGTSFSLKKPV